MKKFNNGGEYKIKRINYLGERLSELGMTGGAGRYKGKKKVTPIKKNVINQSKVGKRKTRKMTTTEVATARAAQLPIGVKMEGKKYGLPAAPKTRFRKGKDKFAQYKKLVLKKRDRKNPSRDFLPRAGQPTIREAHYQTYGPNYKKTKKPDDKFYEYNKGGKVMKNKPIKAGLGLMMLMNHMKKMGKKQGRAQAAQGEAEVLAAQNAAKQNSGMGMSKMNKGGYVSGSYIQDEYSETNSSTKDYYKDMLD